MSNCKECNTELPKSTGTYPCGPCPVSCPNCGKLCCPECGGNMGRILNCDEMDRYTSGGCHDCSYTCCGGCI